MPRRPPGGDPHLCRAQALDVAVIVRLDAGLVIILSHNLRRDLACSDAPSRVRHWVRRGRRWQHRLRAGGRGKRAVRAAAGSAKLQSARSATGACDAPQAARACMSLLACGYMTGTNQTSFLKGSVRAMRWQRQGAACGRSAIAAAAARSQADQRPKRLGRPLALRKGARTRTCHSKASHCLQPPVIAPSPAKLAQITI